jgi:hypothetical protein
MRSEEASTRPFQREDQVPRTIIVDGRPREAFTIPPSAGERFGFEPGDVILVAPTAATAPSAGPAAAD